MSAPTRRRVLVLAAVGLACVPGVRPRSVRGQTPVVPECASPGTVFQVDPAVAPDSVDDVREAIELADAFFRQTFGRGLCTRLIVRILAGEARRGVAGVFGGDVIEVGTGHPWWRTHPKRHERVKLVVHECVHVLQDELGGLRGAPDDQVRPDGPAWLREGSAELVAWRALDWRGFAAHGDRRAAFVAAVRQAPPVALASMETLRGFGVTGYPRHELAVLAVDALIKDRGLPSLARYYAATARIAWPEAFGQAFGRSPGAFYQEFDVYRRTDLGAPS